MSMFDYGAYPELNFRNSGYGNDGRPGYSREEMELDEKALDLMKKIRDCKTYLRARLKKIEDENQHLLLQDDVENIHFWLALAQEVRADCVYGVDTLEIAYQDILNMARKYPMNEILPRGHDDPMEEEDSASAADPRLRNRNPTAHNQTASKDTVPSPELVRNPLSSPNQGEGQGGQSEGGTECWGQNWKSGFSPGSYPTETPSPDKSRVPFLGRGRGRTTPTQEPVIGNVPRQAENHSYHPPGPTTSNYYNPPGPPTSNYHPPGPTTSNIRPPQAYNQNVARESPRFEVQRESPRFEMQREPPRSEMQGEPGRFESRESPNFENHQDEFESVQYRPPPDPREQLPRDNFRPAAPSSVNQRPLNPYHSQGPPIFNDPRGNGNMPRPFVNFSVPDQRPLLHGIGPSGFLPAGGNGGNFLNGANFQLNHIPPQNPSNWNPNLSPQPPSQAKSAPRPSQNLFPPMHVPQVAPTQPPAITPDMFRQKALNHFGKRAPGGGRPRFQRYFNPRPPHPNDKNHNQRNQHRNQNRHRHNEKTPEKNTEPAVPDPVPDTFDQDFPESSAPDRDVPDPADALSDPRSPDSPPPEPNRIRTVADNRKARLSQLNRKEMLDRVRLELLKKKTQKPPPRGNIQDLKKTMATPGYFKLGTKSKNNFEKAPEPEPAVTTEVEDPPAQAPAPTKSLATPSKTRKKLKTKPKTPTPKQPTHNEPDRSDSETPAPEVTPRKKTPKKPPTPKTSVRKRQTAARKSPREEQVKIKLPFNTRSSPRVATKPRVIYSSSESEDESSPPPPAKTPTSSSESENESSEDEETIYLRSILEKWEFPAEDVAQLLENGSQKKEILDMIKSLIAESGNNSSEASGRQARSPGPERESEEETMSTQPPEPPPVLEVLKAMATGPVEGSEDFQEDSRLSRKRKQDNQNQEDQPDNLRNEAEPEVPPNSSPAKKRGRPNRPGKSQYSIPDPILQNQKTKSIQPALIPVHNGLVKIKMEADYFASNVKIEPQAFDDNE